MFKDVLHKSLTLMIVAGTAGLLLSASYSYTKPYIDKNKKELIQAAEKEVGGTPMSVSAKGYGGDIDMMVGIQNKMVTGVKIIKMTETPGLGTLAISQEPMKGHTFTFLEQFKQKSLHDKLIAKSDIVAITGATITSQAIANGVRNALQEYDGLEVTSATKQVSENIHEK